MSVIELSELRYFWQRRAPAGHHLMHMVQRLADKYEFTADERLQLGNALQAYSDELLAVHGRLEAARAADEI